MGDENSGLNIKADLAPVLTATPTGLKFIFNLLLGKRHAEAERLIKLSDAQNAVDVKKIISGEAFFDHSTLKLVESEQLPVNLLIAEKIRNEETSNLIECSMHAANYIEASKEDVSLESQDFINRWKSEAKLISSEEAQTIWGRVLAQEVNSPGSISLRTIDVIKNLSKEEALNFNNVCKYVVFDSMVVDNQAGTPITHQEFSSIRDAGLIASYSPGMYRSYKWVQTTLSIPEEDDITVFYVRCGDLFIFLEESRLSELQITTPTFTFWELTTAGRELYKVVRESLPVEITDAAKVLNKSGEEFIKKAKYTRYTNVERNEVDTQSIKCVEG